MRRRLRSLCTWLRKRRSKRAWPSSPCWISVLTALFDQRCESQKQFVEVMRTCFGDSVFQRVFFHSSEVINSAAQFVGPYEQPKPNRRSEERRVGKECRSGWS